MTPATRVCAVCGRASDKFYWCPVKIGRLPVEEAVCKACFIEGVSHD